MMALPTLTLDKTEADKIIAVFGDADTYLDWLAGVLRDELERRTARQLDEAHNEAKRVALLALRDELPVVDAPTGEPAP